MKSRKEKKEYQRDEKIITRNLNDTVRELIEYKAIRKDNEISNDLLKELVLKYAATERKLARLNKELNEKQNHLEEDLKAAAGIQKSLLPQNVPTLKDLDIAWKFVPCEAVGGDILDVFRLDEDHVGFYIMDISGHGVPSAMVTVSVSQMFQAQESNLTKRKVPTPPFYELVSPKEVMEALDQEYPIERFDKFFTIVYLVLNMSKRCMLYSNAGHPPPILIHEDGSLSLLEQRGTIIGMEGIIPFEEEKIFFQDGDRLILYTDGITEYQRGEEEFFGDERFYALLKSLKDEPIDQILEGAYEGLMEFGGHANVQDDVTLLGIEFKKREPK